MEVTRNNFEEILPEVLNDIKACSFVALDGELTGLWMRDEPKQLDFPNDYYDKFLSNSSNFICIQVGMTFFRENKSTNKYECKTYNFYTYPSQHFKNSNYSFACQASCIDFLCSHNFDFNKCFHEGIPYLNIEKEAYLSEKLEERRFFKEKNANKEMEIIDIPDDLKRPVEEASDKLCSVLNSDCAEDEARVPGQNGYVRRLIYQTIKQRYPNGEVFVETRDGVLVSRKAPGSNEEVKSLAEIDEETISKAVGFSKVFRALAKSAKPIVGHNMFLDLCHYMNNFLCALPQSYSDFKDLLRCTFPNLVDCKYMASNRGFQDLISVTMTDRLYSRLSETPFSLPDLDLVPGRSYSEDDKKFHEAGFDSYITGSSFLAMYNYLVSAKSSMTPEFNFKSDKLKHITGRIFLNNTVDSHVYVSGPDPEPDRSHYFHVTFPNDWVTSDIHQIFSVYGRTMVNWINDTTAWVSLMDHTQADACKSSLCCRSSKLPRGVAVLPYSPAIYRSMSLAKKRSLVDSGPPTSPHPKRRKSSRESNLLNRSTIETIPEENEDETMDDDRIDQSNGSNSFEKETDTRVVKRKCKRKSKEHSESAVEQLEKDMDLNISGLFEGSPSW